MGALGVLVWQLTLPKLPTKKEALALVIAQGFAPSLAPAEIEITPRLRKHGEPVEVSTQTTWTLKTDLYQPVDTARWFAEQAGLTPDRVARNADAVRGADWERIQPFVQAGVPRTDFASLILLRKVASAGTQYRSTERIVSERSEGGTRFRVVDSGWTGAGGPPAGEARAAFREDALVVDRESDVGMLLALAEAHNAFEKAYARGVDLFRADMEKKRDSTIQKCLERIAPGSFYRAIVETRHGQSTLHLEFVKPTAPATVAAIMRDAASWEETRIFSGSWKYEDARGDVSLSLNSPREAAIANAGPFLGGDWGGGIQLRITDRSLEGSSDQITYSFERRTEAQVAADRSEALAVARSMAEMLTEGSAFRGSMSARDGSESADVLFRITQTGNGTLKVTIENAASPECFRSFSGSVITNAYRHQGWPLVLYSSPKDHGKAGPPHPWWTADSAVEAKWRLDGDKLIGNASSTTFNLSRLSASEIAALDSSRRAAQEAVFGRIQPSTTLTGLISLGRRGPGTKCMLKVRTLDREEQTVELTISSARDPRNTISYQGSVSWADGRIMLRRKSGSVNDGDSVFRRAMESLGNLVLQVTEEGLATGTAADSHMSIEFPFAGVLESVATDFSGEERVRAPAQEGAFVLIDNQWHPLPQNNSRVVQPKTDIVLGIAAGLLRTPEEAKAMQSRPDEMGDVVFDGSDAVPVVTGPLVICVRGKPKDFERPAKIPPDYPILECAPLAVDATGARRAKIYRIVVGLAGFVLNRVEGDIEQLSEDVYVFRSVGELPAGRYAVSAKVPVEVEVR